LKKTLCREANDIFLFISPVNPSYWFVCLSNSLESEVYEILLQRFPKKVTCAEMGTLISSIFHPRGKLIDAIEPLYMVITSFPPVNKVPYFALSSSHSEYKSYREMSDTRTFSQSEFEEFVKNILQFRSPYPVTSQEISNLLPPHLRPGVGKLLSALQKIQRISIKQRNAYTYDLSLT
jgi:hypothetical protein